MATANSALRAVETFAACLKCGGKPLIETEVERGFCSDCWSKRWLKCRVCEVLLGRDPTHNHKRGICELCLKRPEARKFLDPKPTTAPAAVSTKAPRPFTPADRALMKTLHSHLPIAELLRILNDRLVADVGPAAPRYTLEQLHAELHNITQHASASADDWTSLRRLIGQARRDGVLERLTPQLLEDFCVVFQLTAAQRTHVLDTIQHAKEEQ